MWTLQRVFMGENPAYKNFTDMNLREVACAVPLVVLSVALGVAPLFLVLSWMGPSVDGLVDALTKVGP